MKNENLKSYKFIRFLGKGTYGKVFLYVNTKTKKPVAIKFIKKDVLTSEIKEEIYNEVHVLEKISKKRCNKYITCMRGHGETDKYVYIILDYIPGFELSKITLPLDPNNLVFLFTQLLRGVNYIHKNGIVHMDLKPENVMCHIKQKLIKIVDFGLSCMKIYCNHIGGTPNFMAPEMLNEYIHGKSTINLEIAKKSDIFSLGVMFYLLTMRKMPISVRKDYKTIKHMKQILKVYKLHNIKCDYQSGNQDFDSALNKFINKMTNVDFKLRPTAEEALKELKEISRFLNKTN